jgi:hypothetical protein
MTQLSLTLPRNQFKERAGTGKFKHLRALLLDPIVDYQGNRVIRGNLGGY